MGDLLLVYLQIWKFLKNALSNKTYISCAQSCFLVQLGIAACTTAWYLEQKPVLKEFMVINKYFSSSDLYFQKYIQIHLKKMANAQQMCFHLAWLIGHYDFQEA